MSHRTGRRDWLRGNFLMSLLTGLLVCSLAAVESLAIDYEGLVAALKAREGRMQSIDVSWTAVNDYSPAYVRRMSGGGDPFGDGPAPANPQVTAQQVPWSGRLAASGDKIRNENDYPLWNSLGGGGFVRPKCTITSDGRQCQSLRGQGPPSIFPFSGDVADHKASQFQFFGTPFQSAIWWTFRPTHQGGSRVNQMITPDAQLATEHHEGRDYLAIRKSAVDTRGVGREFLMLLDPAQDYSLRLFLLRRNKTLSQRIVIESMQTENGFWVPKSWREERFNSLGVLEQFQVGTVTKCEVNPELDPGLFQIAFPSWTLVTDQLRGPQEVYYIVLPDGKEHVVPREKLFRKKGEIRRKEDFLPPEVRL